MEVQMSLLTTLVVMTVVLTVKYEGAMKRISFVFGAAMAAIFALTSCNKEISNPDEIIKDGIPFEISAASADTKTSNNGLATNWVAGDALNLFHAVADSKTYISDGSFSIAEKDLDSKKFKGTLEDALEEGNYDWYALYPYNQYVSTPANTGTQGYVTVGGKSQTQEGNSSMAHLCRYVCPLYGVAKSVESSSTPGITMNHLTSIIEVNVTNNSGKDLTVTSVSFTGTENIVGTYYIDFTQTPVVYTSRGETYVSNMASLSVTGGEAITVGASAKFYIAIKPFTATSGNTLTVSVNGYKKVINLTKDVTFTAGLIKTINFNYDKKTVSLVYTLMEEDGAFEDGGSYVLAFKDGKDGSYYFINNAGTDNNLKKDEFTVTDGKLTNSDLSYVFVANEVSGGFTLKNSLNNYIYNSGENTSLDTNNETPTTWVASYLQASKSYKISNGSATGRYISYSSTTAIKAYANSNYKDQISDKTTLAQYAGAISVFKYIDPTVPKLSVTPTSKTWASEETDAAVFTVTTNTEGEKDWSVSPETLDWATIAVDKNAGTITVTPKDENTTGNAREETLTVTHSAGGLSETITLTQKAEGAGEAVVKTYRHVFTAKPSTGDNVTLSGVSWNIQAKNLNGYNSANYAGVQFGTSGKNGQITLTSPSAWSYTADGVTVTKIKEVRLWLNLGGTSVTPSVKIGDQAANSDGKTVTKNSNAGSDWTKTTKVTFTPATGYDTGVIVIDVTSVKAGYICAIEIDAE